MENISLEMTAALFRAADAPVIGTEGSKVVFATPAAVRALGSARLHGGELLLDTTPGVGTTVMVTLPRRQNPKLTLRAGAADYSTADRTTVLTELSDALEAEELL